MLLACELYRIRVFLAVLKVLSLNTAGGWYLIWCCTEGLLKVAPVPPKRGFSRNCRVKCAVSKIPILFFSLLVFHLSFCMCSIYGCNIRSWKVIKHLTVRLLLASSSCAGSFNLHVAVLQKVLRNFFRNPDVRICL